MRPLDFLFCLALLLCLHAPPLHAQTFRFGAIPHRSADREAFLYGEVAKFLSKELGVEVEFVPAGDYREAIQQFAEGKTQLGWFGGLTGVIATSRVPGSQAIAQGYEDQFFKTLFIAHHTVDIERGPEFPLGIRGLSFAFGDQYSTSGRLMPEYHIRQNFGKAPRDVFERIGFSGKHEKTILWLEEGIYDVGAVSFVEWYSALQRGMVDATKVRIIWETPPYPDYHFVVRGDVEKEFGEGFVESLTEAIFGLNAHRELLQVFGRSHFVAARDSDYRVIAQTASRIGFSGAGPQGAPADVPAKGIAPQLED